MKINKKGKLVITPAALMIIFLALSDCFVGENALVCSSHHYPLTKKEAKHSSASKGTLYSVIQRYSILCVAFCLDLLDRISFEEKDIISAIFQTKAMS